MHLCVLSRNSFSAVKQNEQKDSFKGMPKQINGYVVSSKVIGKGSFGEIRDAFCTKTKKNVAVKICSVGGLAKIAFSSNPFKTPKEMLYTDETLRKLLIGREFGICSKLKNKSVVDHYEMFAVCDGEVLQKGEALRGRADVYVTMERCKESLQDAVLGGKLDAAAIKKHFREIVEGVDYLHANSVFHFDLKPGNILLSGDGTAKIGDFGVAKTKETTGDINTTPVVLPPEGADFENELFSPRKADIWALGVVLYFMHHRRYPFSGKDRFELWKNIREATHVEFETEEKELKDLAGKLLARDPEHRPTPAQILGHAYLRSP
ncbi:MAG: CAMK/CAMKL protein kinase [Amphiamblys sp. WSBS2006]|nr:MAG: CAMK/CAMKL protein kinase [Amphiamblys sp. WSBS2006]